MQPGANVAAGPEELSHHRGLTPSETALMTRPQRSIKKCCDPYVCLPVCPVHRGTARKQTRNHRYGDNRKMAAGFAYRI